MYGATELSKMFKVSKPTIYAKFKDTRLKEYLTLIDGKQRFRQEGLQLLGQLLAETNKNKTIVKLDVNINDNLHVSIPTKSEVKPDEGTQLYIQELKEQIKELKDDKNKLQENLKSALNTLSEQQKLLNAPEPPKKTKNIWRIFGVSD